jgi:hypothetical protein
MSFREGMTAAAVCIGIGLALTAWGLAAVVIVPVDRLLTRLRIPRAAH